MQRNRLLLAGAIALVIFLNFAILLAVFTPQIREFFKKSSGYNTSAVLQQVQTVSELVTVKYIIEKVVILEDVKWIAGLGENRVLLLAHGVVKGGIDLGKLQPGDISISGKKVTIKLPQAQIMEAYLDDRQTKVIERTTGLLRSFDKDLEQNARVDALEDIKRAARNGGILKEADVRARAQLTALFKQMGFETVEFRK